MTPVPLLFALVVQKVRGLLGYKTEGRCPVAVTGDPEDIDMKESESKQKLVKGNSSSNSSEEEQDMLAAGGENIVKKRPEESKCPVVGHA